MRKDGDRQVRRRGLAAYIGDGTHRGRGVHPRDAARLYRLAIEPDAAHAIYLAIAEEGLPLGEIAGVIGRRLNLPVVSQERRGGPGAFRLVRGARCSGVDLVFGYCGCPERSRGHPYPPVVGCRVNPTRD